MFFSYLVREIHLLRHGLVLRHLVCASAVSSSSVGHARRRRGGRRTDVHPGGVVVSVVRRGRRGRQHVGCRRGSRRLRPVVRRGLVIVVRVVVRVVRRPMVRVVWRRRRRGGGRQRVGQRGGGRGGVVRRGCGCSGGRGGIRRRRGGSGGGGRGGGGKGGDETGEVPRDSSLKEIKKYTCLIRLVQKCQR